MKCRMMREGYNHFSNSSRSTCFNAFIYLKYADKALDDLAGGIIQALAPSEIDEATECMKGRDLNFLRIDSAISNVH